MLGNADEDELAALVAACADGFQQGLSAPPAARAFAAKIVAHAELIVRRGADGKLVGCVAFYCNDRATLAAFVTLVAVDPACRGRGMARAMLGECVATARERGFRHVKLRVLQRNREAIPLYRAMGFVATEEGRDDLGMSLDLSAA